MQRVQPTLVKGRFVNPPQPQAPPRAELRDFLRWRRERVPPPKTADVPRVARPPERLPDPPEKGWRATWVGHSTVVLQVDGKTFVTDPVWSDRIATVIPRRTPPGIPFSALPPVDALLLSHDHYDHLDAGTLARFPRSTPVVCPTGVGRWFRSRGWTRVMETSWWESVAIEGHRVSCTPAQHFSGRTLWDRDRSLWGGFVVTGDRGTRVWFAGDTGYNTYFPQVAQAFPAIDLALVPAGAYLPRWFMSPVHVDPPEATQVFLDAGARVMLPIHYGTFLLADEPLDAPPGALREEWKARDLDASRLLLPAMGASVGEP